MLFSCCILQSNDERCLRKQKKEKNFQNTDIHEACVNIGTAAPCGCGILWSLYCRVFIHTTGLTHWIPGTSFSVLQPKLTTNTAKCPLEVKTTGWESRTVGLDLGSLEFVPCYSLCISNPHSSHKCWAICLFPLSPCLEIALYLGSCARLGSGLAEWSASYCVERGGRQWSTRLGCMADMWVARLP